MFYSSVHSPNTSVMQLSIVHASLHVKIDPSVYLDACTRSHHEASNPAHPQLAPQTPHPPSCGVLVHQADSPDRVQAERSRRWRGSRGREERRVVRGISQVSAALVVDHSICQSPLSDRSFFLTLPRRWPRKLLKVSYTPILPPFSGQWLVSQFCYWLRLAAPGMSDGPTACRLAS